MMLAYTWLCLCFYRQQTALHKAAWYGYRTICHTLVEAGASINRLDYQNNTPYDKAKQNGDRELARYLKGKIFMYSFVTMCVYPYVCIRPRTQTADQQG